MSASLNEQTVRLQIAALTHRVGFKQAIKETGLTRHQLMSLGGGHRVHAGTLSQAAAALGMAPKAMAITTQPIASDIGG